MQSCSDNEGSQVEWLCLQVLMPKHFFQVMNTFPIIRKWKIVSVGQAFLYRIVTTQAGVFFQHMEQSKRRGKLNLDDIVGGCDYGIQETTMIQHKPALMCEAILNCVNALTHRLL